MREHGRDLDDVGVPLFMAAFPQKTPPSVVVEPGDGSLDRRVPRRRLASETMGSLHRSETFPCRGQVEREAIELFEMECGEGFEPRRSEIGELESDQPVVVGIPAARHQPSTFGPVDELNSAVVTQQ